MSRITVEAVKEAMERTGLKLVAKRWGDGMLCGCPQTILCVAAGNNGEDTIDWADRTYGEDYASNFRHAYDTFHTSSCPGSQDGYTVRMALLPPGKEE